MCQMDRKLLSMVFIDKPPKQKEQDKKPIILCINDYWIGNHK